MSIIIEGTINKLDELTILFDLYRQFYRQPSNIVETKLFLNERMSKKESIIFVSKEDNDSLSGFVQLYPIFTSVGLKRCWILNDLFVKADHRKKGIARKLIDRCKNLQKKPMPQVYYSKHQKIIWKGMYCTQRKVLPLWMNRIFIFGKMFFNFFLILDS